MDTTIAPNRQRLSSEPVDIAAATDEILNDLRVEYCNHPFVTFGLFVSGGYVATPVTTAKGALRAEPALIQHLLRQRYQFSDSSGSTVDVPEAVAVAVLAILPFSCLGSSLAEAQMRHAAWRAAR